MMSSSFTARGGVVAQRIIPIGERRVDYRWSEKLSTRHGERVAMAVGAFAGMPISLASAVPHLNLEAAAAYIGISPNPAPGFASVSVSGFTRAAAALPDPIRNRVVKDFAIATSGAIIVPLPATLRRAMGDDGDADFAIALAEDEEIATADVIMPDAGLATLAALARSTVRRTVACQALLLARGRFDLADKVGEFTRLMRMGNIPLGLMSDRTLIVLVA